MFASSPAAPVAVLERPHHHARHHSHQPLSPSHPRHNPKHRSGHLSSSPRPLHVSPRDGGGGPSPVLRHSHHHQPTPYRSKKHHPDDLALGRPRDAVWESHLTSPRSAHHRHTPHSAPVLTRPAEDAKLVHRRTVAPATPPLATYHSSNVEGLDLAALRPLSPASAPPSLPTFIKAAAERILSRNAGAGAGGGGGTPGSATPPSHRAATAAAAAAAASPFTAAAFYEEDEAARVVSARRQARHRHHSHVFYPSSSEDEPYDCDLDFDYVNKAPDPYLPSSRVLAPHRLKRHASIGALPTVRFGREEEIAEKKSHAPHRHAERERNSAHRRHPSQQYYDESKRAEQYERRLEHAGHAHGRTHGSGGGGNGGSHRHAAAQPYGGKGGQDGRDRHHHQQHGHGHQQHPPPRHPHDEARRSHHHNHHHHHHRPRTATATGGGESLPVLTRALESLHLVSVSERASHSPPHHHHRHHHQHQQPHLAPPHHSHSHSHRHHHEPHSDLLAPPPYAGPHHAYHGRSHGRSHSRHRRLS